MPRLPVQVSMYAKNLFVGIAYEIRLAGFPDVIERHPPEHPYVFQLGKGEILPAVEQAMAGAKLHERRTFTVPPEAAFGPYDVQARAVFPRNIFDRNIELKPGYLVKVQRQSGSFQSMTILFVAHDTVMLDMNHPYAGKPLLVSDAQIVPTPFSNTSLYYDLPRGDALH